MAAGLQVIGGLPVARQAGLRRRSGASPLGLLEPLGLEESERDHAHEEVSTQTLPRQPFEVVEAKLLLELLIGLLANQRALMAPASCLTGISAGRLER